MYEILLIALFIYVIISMSKTGQRFRAVEKELQTLREMVSNGAVAAPQDQLFAGQSAVRQEADGEQPVVLTTANILDDEPALAPGSETADLAPLAARLNESDAVDVSALPERESFESRLGARWAVWAGGLALALGGIFLVKYSIESGLLSPAVRLTLAGLFGLFLAAAGEAIRRKAVPGVAAAYSNAMIPGVLTAAGALTLFGVIYAAYGIYDYIGPTTGFLLLGIVAFATLGLSLLHGQALAGLGLLGSMVTPVLITSTAPNIWALFGFLTVSWLATAAASRRQAWAVVPALANIGLGLWAFGYSTVTALSNDSYSANGLTVDYLPQSLALLAMIAGTLFLWPAKAFEDKWDEGLPAADLQVDAPEQTDAADENTSGETSPRRPIRQLLGRRPRSIGITVSLSAVLSALPLLFVFGRLSGPPAFAMAAILAALAGLGASRHFAVWPALLAALGALAGVALIAGATDTALELSGLVTGSQIVPAFVQGAYTQIAIALGLGAIFVLCGFSFLKRLGGRDESFATLWAAIMAIVPVWIATISFVQLGNLSRDWLHGFYGIALGAVLLASAEWLHRRNNAAAVRRPLNLLALGSFAAFAFSLHALTEGLATTVLLAVLGFAYVMATRVRNWQALPWMMALASIGVLARIAWEPSLVGPLNLGKTPVFNALLPGYGIPALLAIIAAYELRHWPGERVRNFLQAIASLMGLLTLAILVRHAMNGGVLDSGVPTLGEQSIYTLLTIGLSGVLMTLDFKSPSPIFNYGSVIAGVLAMFNVLGAHFGALNPYFSGENTGPWPFLNLLLIGYLMPGLAYAGLAYYARGKRPQPYVVLLALSGAALGFAWATLSVRRFWQGENIADWKGFLQGETYSYSVVWLVLGVVLLGLGSRFNAKSLRLASAGLVLLAVAKAFLIDMSNLEGVLRALSFIGLGVVLIGIGLFYQKILTGKSGATVANLKEP